MFNYISFCFSFMQKFFGDNYYREEDDEKPQFDEDFEGEDLFFIFNCCKEILSFYFKSCVSWLIVFLGIEVSED